jgi:FkbM family methyltransferase
MKLSLSFLAAHLPPGLIRRLKRIYYPWILRRFPEERWPFSTVVKRLAKPGECVVDAGANVGYVTLLLSRWVGEKGSVHSFEPVPETFEWLSESVRKLNLQNVTLHNCGLSDTARGATMGIPRYLSGGENLYESRVVEDGRGARFARTVNVSLNTLDALLADSAQRVSFIKIDVEGHELLAVKGALRVISRDKPALLIEVTGDPDRRDSPAGELFALLGGIGYDAFCWEQGILKKRTAGVHCGDYVFLQPTHLPLVSSLAPPADLQNRAIS